MSNTSQNRNPVNPSLGGGLNELQRLAADYASHGLAAFPALPHSKEPIARWKAFQFQAPNQSEREALFSINASLNIGLLCGAASRNLAVIDCESRQAFETNIGRVVRAGFGETWMAESARGGHIYFRTPVPIKPVKCDGDMEIRGQSQFLLAPCSRHPHGPVYRFINQSPEIAQLESLREFNWLKLEPAQLHSLRIPHTAYLLLIGRSPKHYNSRSEAEQAIVTILVNASFTFDQVLVAFRTYSAVGKFKEIEQTDGVEIAEAWLRRSFNKAREFCIQESPTRLRTREFLAEALSNPWPGRTGSTDRAIYAALATLAYQSGKEVFHASSRNLAELAGCTRDTASAASRRLCANHLVRLESKSTAIYANKFKLLRCRTSRHSLRPICEGVAQTSTLFCLPDAFRKRGLGRSAFEVFTALDGQSATVAELSARTGRHRHTVGAVLKRMVNFGFVWQEGKTWFGCDPSEIDARGAELGMNGNILRQKEKHRAQRLRYEVSRALVRQAERRYEVSRALVRQAEIRQRLVEGGVTPK